MRKILLFLCLFAVSSFALNLVTWDGSASTVLNDTANWTGTVASGSTLGDGDSLLFNSGSVAATANADLSVGAITSTSGYSGNISFSGRALTVANGASFDGTGTVNLGVSVTVNGNSATFHIGSGSGAITATACAITLNGTTAMILDIDKTINKGLSLTLGASAKVTNTGGGLLILQNTSAPVYALGASATFTNTAGGTFMDLATSGDFFSLGASAAFAGAGTMNFRMGTGTGQTFNIPAYSCPGAVNWSDFAAKTNCISRLTGNMNIGSGNDLTIGSGTSGACLYDANDFNIVCGALRINGQPADTVRTGNGTHTIVTLVANLATVSSYYWEASVFNISGSVSFGVNKIINAGTSVMNILNTATITTANLSHAIHDLTINASTKTITLADSLLLGTGDLTITAGTLLGKSKNYHVTDLVVSNGATFNDSLASVYVAGNATFGSTSTRPTSTGKYIFSAGTTHSFATGGRRFDSVSVLGSTSISVSDTMGLFMAPAVRVTNANTITLLAYDIEGSTGSLDSLTGGTINIPANDTLDFIYMSGVTLAVGDTLWVKTSASGGEGIDGGGNSGNIIFLGATTSTTGLKRKKGLSIGNGLMITTD